MEIVECVRCARAVGLLLPAPTLAAGEALLEATAPAAACASLCCSRGRAGCTCGLLGTLFACFVPVREAAQFIGLGVWRVWNTARPSSIIPTYSSFVEQAKAQSDQCSSIETRLARCKTTIWPQIRGDCALFELVGDLGRRWAPDLARLLHIRRERERLHLFTCSSRSRCLHSTTLS